MKRRSVFGSLFMAGLAFLIFWGCGGGGDGGSSTNPALLGRAEGYAFLQSGIIVLSNSPTPPAGATALSGATITVDGKSGSVTTDSTGHFTVADVPVGQRKLHLSGGGTTLDVPLTVIGAATIPIGTFVVSRTQAIDAAKTAVAGLGSLANFQILAAQQPLPSGAVVKPALGDDDGKDSTALTVTTATAQWFVFVDQQPGARFQHPAVFVFIDANTGAVTTRSVSSWPRINSVHHYSDDDKNATAQDLVQVGTRKVLPTSGSQVVSDLQRIKPRLVTRDHVAGATNPKTYALLIDGNSRSDMFADLDNVQRQLFGPSGLSGQSEIKTWSPPETVNLNAVKQIKILFDDICAKARPEDTVLIYISSHGSKSGAIYIQQGIQSDESVTEDDFLFPYIDLNTSKCAACHVIFIVDTCYAGASMVDMAVKSPPHAGQKLTYIAASSSAETSGGITRYAHARTGKAAGGVFTNAFLNGLKDFSEANGGANQGNLQRIFDDAAHGLTYAHAARWHHQLSPGTDTVRLAMFTAFLAQWTGRHEWHTKVAERDEGRSLTGTVMEAGEALQREALLDNASAFIVYAHGIKNSRAAAREAARTGSTLPLQAVARLLDSPRLERFVAANVARSIEFLAGRAPHDE